MLKRWDFRLPRLPISHWLTIALTLVTIGMVMYEVQDLKQQIRQANYAAIVSNLRAALIERWVETQVLPQQRAEDDVIAPNPMRL